MIWQSKVSVATLFSAICDLAIGYSRVWVVAVGFIAALTTVLDIVMAKGAGAPFASFLVAIVNFFVTYHVTEAILRGEGLLVTSSRSYASLLGASILTTLGIGLAFVLLIVPGLYCAARWSMVAPLIVAEGRSASDALTVSWDRTKDSVWAIFGVYVAYIAAFAVVVAVAAGAGALATVEGGAAVADTSSMTVQLAVNLASSALGIFGVLISVAVYRALIGNGAQYEDVFA